MREPIDKSPDSRVYCAKIKPSQNRSTNLPAICYHSRSYILRNSKSYCTSRIPFSFSRRSLSNLTRGIRVLLSSERPKRERRPDARQPPGLSRDSPLPPLSLSSSAAPFLCPRYRPSYPARGCANYIGGRESASRVDNRNRLQTFRMAPATISTSCISRYILFPPCAFPPATTNNTNAPRRRPRRDDNKVVGKAIVRLANRPPRTFLVSEVARRLLYDRRTMARTTKTTKMPFSSRKTSWFCRNLSSFPTFRSFYLSTAFFHFRFLSFTCDFSASSTRSAMYANTCA